MAWRFAVVAVALTLAGCFGGPPTPPAEDGYSLEKVAGDFDFLAQFTFAPDGRVFFTERLQGLVRVIENGSLREEPFAEVEVTGRGEQGLLGIALHPRYPEDPWVYLYHSYEANGSTWNRLLRMRDEGGRGVEAQTLLDRIPGDVYHDGGALAFGPDGNLWVTTGEAHNRGPAQEVDSVSGKILRFTPEGGPAPDNPFSASNPAYTMGHRNVFGIAFDAQGRAWITENGPGSNDEVNLLQPGGNYGWPEVTGRRGEGRFLDPLWVWEDSIAPTGIALAGPAYPGLSGNVVVGDWITGSVRHLRREGSGIAGETLLATAPEGITDIETGRDGALYVATSKAIYRLRGP